VFLHVTTSAYADENAATNRANLTEVRNQMDDDVTPIPAGMGALIVPSLTKPGQEPLVVIFHDGRRVASGPTGRRIVMPPATYEVVVGSGSMEDRPRQVVEIVEGVTSPVPPFFGAVRVDIIDAGGKPMARDYVISSTDGKRTIGPISVRGGNEYEPGDTWILRPGNYVIALGSSADAHADRFAISVAPGQVMRYRLVVDEARLLRADLVSKDMRYEPSIWRFRWVIGGNVSGRYQQQALSGLNGNSIMIDGFTRFEGGIDSGNNLALVTLTANQSLVGVASQNGIDSPLQSLVNEAALEVLYTYRASRIFGPYIRAIGWTSFLPTRFHPSVASTVHVSDEAGNPIGTEFVQARAPLETFSAFAPTILQAGAGLGVSPVDNRYVTLLARAGVAGRQWYYGGGRVITAVNGADISVTKLGEQFRFGGEATVGFGLRLGNVINYETTLNGFMPVEQFIGDEKVKPNFRWDNTVTLKLSTVASVVYQGRFGYDHPKVPTYQVSHLLALRLQYAVF
jgi:hypothetical protein